MTAVRPGRRRRRRRRWDRRPAGGARGRRLAARAGARIGDGRRARRRPDLVVRGRRGGGARGRALAAAVGGDGVRRGRPGLGRRAGRARPVRDGRGGVARAARDRPARATTSTAAARARCCWAASGSAGGSRTPTTPGRRSARPRWCCRELLLTVDPGGPADGVDRRRLDAGDASRRPAMDGPALERQWIRLVERARAIEPGPNGMVARPVFAPLTVVDEQPGHEAWDRLVGTFAGAVGRGRIDKVVLARRVGLRSPVELDVPNALRRLAASAPESTIFAFRRGGRTFLGATPERLRGRRADRSARSRSRARSGAAPTPPRTRPWPPSCWRRRRIARSRRSSSTRSATSWRRSPTPSWWRPSRPSCACASSSTWRPRSPARCRRPGAALDRGPAPPDAGGRRCPAGRRAGAPRRARGLRPRLVRRADRLAGGRRGRRAVRRAALRDRRPHARHAVRRLRDRRRLGSGRRVGGVADQAPGGRVGARHPGRRAVTDANGPAARSSTSWPRPASATRSCARIAVDAARAGAAGQRRPSASGSCSTSGPPGSSPWAWPAPTAGRSSCS